MTAPKARLIAVDGVHAASVLAAARQLLGTPAAGGISHWDASGVFQDVVVAEREAGIPSPRTLLLLYAADLAFRLRWEIRPALAEGQTVVAAPYVQTAVAFGRAAGLPAGWLRNLFRFAPRAADRLIVPLPADVKSSGVDGFVGFVCEQMTGRRKGKQARRIVKGTNKRLRESALRAKKRK